MSRSYLFFQPAQLPLTTDLLGDDTVRPFTDLVQVQLALSAALPDLSWDPSPEGALALGVVTVDGAHYEWAVHALPPAPLGEAGVAAVGDASSAGLMVGLRASGRVDSASFVQRVCDATGWIAFDERPQCFQPHAAPVPA